MQSVRVLAVWLSGKAVGIDLSPRPYYVMGPLLFLVMLVPFTINGFAVRESFFVSFLGKLGVSSDQAFAAGFLFFVLTILLATPGRGDPRLGGHAREESQCADPARSRWLSRRSARSSSRTTRRRGSSARSTACAGPSAEVIVVDNASTDGTPDLVRERFPEARLIEQENRGFGAGNNAGMRAGSGRYFLLLNPDAWLMDGALEAMVAFADEHPEAAVVGPRLLNPDGTLQRSVRGYPSPWRIATEYFFLRKLAPHSHALNAFFGEQFDHESVREAEYLFGACLLVRREAVDSVGGFDEDFFLMSEEVDWCYRFRQAGWKILFFPGAEVTHVVGASLNPRAVQGDRARPPAVPAQAPRPPRRRAGEARDALGAAAARGCSSGAIGAAPIVRPRSGWGQATPQRS